MLWDDLERWDGGGVAGRSKREVGGVCVCECISMYLYLYMHM